jgi:phage baseplate assembly protein W
MARSSRQFADLGLSFTSHPSTGDVVLKYDEDAIKQSVRNLISTQHYERPFHPEIGCQIYSLLFENFSPITVSVMRRTIFDVLQTFEPRVIVLEVNIDEQQDENGIEIEVIFRIINSERPITVKTALTRIR